MEDHLFVHSGHIGAGGGDGGGSVWEVKKVKKTNVRVHTETHIAISLMSVLEGGLHYASEWSKIGLNYCSCVWSALAATVVRRDAGGLDEVQNVTEAAGEG